MSFPGLDVSLRFLLQAAECVSRQLITGTCYQFYQCVCVCV